MSVWVCVFLMFHRIFSQSNQAHTLPSEWGSPGCLGSFTSLVSLLCWPGIWGTEEGWSSIAAKWKSQRGKQWFPASGFRLLDQGGAGSGARDRSPICVLSFLVGTQVAPIRPSNRHIHNTILLNNFFKISKCYSNICFEEPGGYINSAMYCIVESEAIYLLLSHTELRWKLSHIWTFNHYIFLFVLFIGF